MTTAGAELQSILDSVARLGAEVEQAEPGAPELGAILATVNELEDRLKRIRGGLGSLIPDADGQLDLQEKTAVDLERALDGLRRATEARQSVG
jgi:ABC-type transporter Mla subunit MlaD